jgi:hypothetical protein
MMISTSLVTKKSTQRDKRSKNMLRPPRIETGKSPDTQFEQWIDRAVTEDHDADEVAAGIVSVTQPGGTLDYEVSPEKVGNEGWFWPWNRAGFLCLERQRLSDAARLFTCAYLAALRFQHAGQYRLQKGMPLSNTSYAYLRADQPHRAILPAILGMVEDAVEGWKPTQTGNFRNLMAANYPEMPARSLADFFISLTRQRGLTPLYPESILDCAKRSEPSFSVDLIAALGETAAAYRAETIAPSLERLYRVWDGLRPDVESVMNRRQAAYGELGSTIPYPGFITVRGESRSADPTAGHKPPPATGEPRTSCSAPWPGSATDEGPPPEARGEYLTSAATAPMARLAVATTKEEYRARGAELLDLYARRLYEETLALKSQVDVLTRSLEESNRHFHEADKQVAVLRTKLQWALSQLQAQTLLDWTLNFLFALGGAVIGFGVSWPGLETGSRRMVVISGSILILIP